MDVVRMLQLIHCYNIILFCRYQHSRHLVTTLDQFADVKADLPKGWEKKLNKEGKVGGCNTYQHMYIVHTSTCTLYMYMYMYSATSIVWLSGLAGYQKIHYHACAEGVTNALI